MTSPDPAEEAAARLEAGFRAVSDAVDAEADDEAAVRFASRVTERLRAMMIGMGEKRGARALRLRDVRSLTFTALGEIMSVTRARAAEIITNARDKAGVADIPVVALAVITSPRGVLISKRTDRTPPWSFIGGEVQPGEDVAQAAVREVREETGAEVIAGQIIGQREHPDTRRRVAYVACQLADSDAEVGITDTGELAEVRWSDLTDARLLMPGLFPAVDAHLARLLDAR